MANTAPSTPETPRRIAMNRSFTVPSKLATSSRNRKATVEIGATKDVETLYVHPNASIIKFSVLSWTSRTERTLASGPLKIYRVPGSVSFLHSGTLLHAILPRSQCWCVDEQSPTHKFTMRVLPDTYYRIELSSQTPEELGKVEEFKGVLGKVLFFERTACPFYRGREEVGPTAEELHERRRSRRISLGPAKRWRLERGYSWKPEGGYEGRGRENEGEMEGSEGSEGEEAEAGGEANMSDEPDATIVGGVGQLSVQTPVRPSDLANMRSVTAPPQLALHTTPPSRIPMGALDGTLEASKPVPVSRSQLDPSRLRTFQPIPTDMPPSPPDSSAGLELAETHVRQQLESVESEPEPVDLEEDPQERLIEAPRVAHSPASLAVQLSSPQSQPAPEQPSDLPQPQAQSPPQPVVTEQAEPPPVTRQRTPEDPFAAIQARILARRSIGGTTTTSFHLPTSKPSSSSSSSSTTSSLASRRSRDPLATDRRGQQNLASALVKKACAVFLGPPAHLVAIMLEIAARFANGALGFGGSSVFESPAGSKRVPGSFDLGSLDAEDLEGEDGRRLGGEEWEEDDGEDDFGVPLRSPVRLARMGGGRGSGKGFGRERRAWGVD